jgi:hypothetical protein
MTTFAAPVRFAHAGRASPGAHELMTLSKGIWRTSLTAGGAVVSVGAMAALLLVGCPSGAVGDPCIPEDEFRENFQGFKLSEENIESRSFQCQTRICLVNHFQGRVSCPKGQGTPTPCDDAHPCTEPDETCNSAGVIIQDCDPTSCGDAAANPENCNKSDGTNPACGNRICNKDGRYCQCGNSSECPENYFCDSGDGKTKMCTIKVCSKPDDPDRCYVPGTNTPVSVEVCSQCAADSNRDANKAVYCSCRCGPPAEGASDADKNFNFCECPETYDCVEIRKNVGLGDAQIAGKYCIKQGTKFDNQTVKCGTVQGHWNVQCAGLGSGG